MRRGRILHDDGQRVNVVKSAIARQNGAGCAGNTAEITARMLHYAASASAGCCCGCGCCMATGRALHAGQHRGQYQPCNSSGICRRDGHAPQISQLPFSRSEIWQFGFIALGQVQVICHSDGSYRFRDISAGGGAVPIRSHARVGRASAGKSCTDTSTRVPSAAWGISVRPPSV